MPGGPQHRRGCCVIHLTRAVAFDQGEVIGIFQLHLAAPQARREGVGVMALGIGPMPVDLRKAIGVTRLIELIAGEVARLLSPGCSSTLAAL